MKLNMRTALILTAALSGVSGPSWASEETALSMVPRGRVLEGHRREFVVKTEAGSKILIEFHRDNTFAEASGRNLNKGDEIQPGNGLISLSTAAHRASKNGKELGLSWHLEEDAQLGWIYEIESDQEGRQLDLIIDAKSGKILGVEERTVVTAE